MNTAGQFKDTDTDHRTGRTTRQMKAAALNAVFIAAGDSVPAAKELAATVSRTDLRIFSSDVLTKAHLDTLKEIVVNSPVVIDHAVQLTIEMRENMSKLGALGILWTQDVPKPPPVVIVHSHDKIVAETITWTLNGTGLTLRDKNGMRLGTLKLSGVAGFNQQEIRANSEVLIERLRILISEENSTTAFVLPQHR